jgi:hypothetical protein
LIAGIIASPVVNAITGAKTTPVDFTTRKRPVRIVSGQHGMAWFKGAVAAHEARVGREGKAPH